MEQWSWALTTFRQIPVLGGMYLGQCCLVGCAGRLVGGPLRQASGYTNGQIIYLAGTFESSLVMTTSPQTHVIKVVKYA